MNIVIAAGGTGGHLYPGIALARALSGHDVHFVVRRGDLGKDILRKEGFSVREISGQGMPRSWTLKWFTFPFHLARGWGESRSLLRELHPDAVVGMGGYLSVPVILQAHRMGIKTLLHEQNVVPGLSNRWLSRWADSVAVSFSESKKYLTGKNVWVSGLPVRPDIGSIDPAVGRERFGLKKDLPTFFVFGGSLGARHLNTLVLDTWPLLVAKGLPFQVLHVTGPKDFERVQTLYRSQSLNAHVLPYCHDMPHAYAAADAVVCRAGASTVAELLVVERPAFLVPYPYASNNHQVENAQIIKEGGWGECVLEKNLNSDRMANFLMTAIMPEAKSAFRKACERRPKEWNPLDAARRLADYLTVKNPL